MLPEFEKRFPPGLYSGEIKKYVEPFVGGGAVLFHVIGKFSFDECHVYDANEELVLAYSVVKKNPHELISLLQQMQQDFLQLDDEKRKEFFYSKREEFNNKKAEIDFENYSDNWIERASMIIFLNKTCYNGLFRVNSKGGFNVPFGRYKNPKIADAENLLSVSDALQNVEIHLGDFEDCKKVVNNSTFVYFDPPYRPLNKTSSFTSYSKDSFNDEDQIRLAGLYKKLDKKGAKLMLSNSDPRNENPDDDFFDELYSNRMYPNFNIERVPATRMINCNAQKRGSINELIVTNYEY
ncbi:MAG: DNA adenine methylase [Methanolobus sp.]